MFVFSVALLVFLWKVYISKQFQMFPNIIDVFVINYELPVGVTLNETEKIGIGFENIRIKQI